MTMLLSQTSLRRIQGRTSLNIQMPHPHPPVEANPSSMNLRCLMTRVFLLSPVPISCL